MCSFDFFLKGLSISDVESKKEMGSTGLKKNKGCYSDVFVSKVQTDESMRTQVIISNQE